MAWWDYRSLASGLIDLWVLTTELLIEFEADGLYLLLDLLLRCFYSLLLTAPTFDGVVIVAADSINFFFDVFYYTNCS